MTRPWTDRRALLAGPLLVGSLGLGSLSLVGCGPRGSASPPLSGTTLRVATYRGNADTFAHQAGLGPAPYEVSLAQFASGTLIAQAINARGIDIGTMSEIPPIFVAQAPGNLVRLIAVLRGDVNNQVVLTPKGSPITRLGELRGKRVGYVQATTSHYILLRILQETGLKWSDIDPVSLSPQDGLAAFLQGSLDAWVIYGVIVQMARAKGANVLATGLHRLSGNYLVAASAEALADPNKRTAIADYLNRYRRILDWINQDDARYAAALGAATGVSPALYLEQFEQRSDRSALEPVTEAAIRSQQGVADVFRQAGVIPAPVDVRPLWRSSFNKELA
jgi:sulfonate transport system substrate-binding protein